MSDGVRSPRRVLGAVVTALGGLLGRHAAASPDAQAPQPEPPVRWPALSRRDRDAVVRVLYGEARGEPIESQRGVVHVLRNRVVARGTSAYVEAHRPAQFSCMWDGQRERVLSLHPGDLIYLRLGEVVDRAWAEPDSTDGACHYWAPAGMKDGRAPKWAARGRVTRRAGGHVFVAGVRL